MHRITLQALDENGVNLFSYEVAHTPRMNVQTLLEHAFVQHQKDDPASPDPFRFLLSYYGYSMDPDYPGYLGYELESIDSRQSDMQHYWELSINGTPSTSGIDSTYPAPGDIVMFRFVAMTAKRGMQNRRVAHIAGRRAANLKSK